MALRRDPPLFYLHGLDSSPQGFRAMFFKRHFPTIQVPKLPNDVAIRLKLLEQKIPTPSFLVGSSLGGLTALLFARDYPERVLGMVLIAPAVATYEPSFWTPQARNEVSNLVIPSTIPTHLIAARGDEIIPLEAIQALHARAENPGGIPFEIFDDSHLLHSEAALSSQLRAVETISGHPLEMQNPTSDG